jgi:recombinational DNA repair protein (RecF pathway)
MILHFYTLERGFQSFIFKGALKKRKALNQMGLYEINYFKRPESDLGIINQLDFAWTPQVLFERPQKVLLVFFMTDILQQTLRHQGPDPKLFYFIRDQLVHLETTDAERKFPTQFLAQYLMLLGYAPLVEEEQAAIFDLQKGSFCQASQGGATSIQDPALVHFLKAQFWPNPEQELSSNLLYKEALRILIQYAQIHLSGFDLDKTMEILHDTLYD